jgi:hypothetical protein
MKSFLQKVYDIVDFTRNFLIVLVILCYLIYSRAYIVLLDQVLIQKFKHLLDYMDYYNNSHGINQILSNYINIIDSFK